MRRTPRGSKSSKVRGRGVTGRLVLLSPSSSIRLPPPPFSPPLPRLSARATGPSRLPIAPPHRTTPPHHPTPPTPPGDPIEGLRKYLPAAKLPPALLVPVKPLKAARHRPAGLAPSSEPAASKGVSREWSSVWAEALAGCGELRSLLRCLPCVVAPETHAFEIVLDVGQRNPLQAGTRRLGKGLAKAGHVAGQGIHGAVSRTGGFVTGAQQASSRDLASQKERRDERQAERTARGERAPKGEHRGSKGEATSRRGLAAKEAPV